MLVAITGRTEIANCQKLLTQTLKQSLKSKGSHNVGFRGGNHKGSMWANDRIWFTTVKITGDIDPVTNQEIATPRYWNAFGLSDDIGQTSSINIAVEINIPINGLNRRVGGVFARDSRSGKIHLLHRGLVGGGRVGIGKEAFLGWYQKELVKVKTTDSDIVDEVIHVANIESKTFVDDIERFVQGVHDFRVAVIQGGVTEATYLTTEQLKKAAKARSKRKVTSTQATVKVFDRDPNVAEYAKRRAEGKCQLCSRKAPFKYNDGRPYLETHHIQWLSKGGSDGVNNTVALCPNCHRKMHILNSPEDAQILKNAIV